MCFVAWIMHLSARLLWNVGICSFFLLLIRLKCSWDHRPSLKYPWISAFLNFSRVFFKYLSQFCTKHMYKHSWIIVSLSLTSGGHTSLFSPRAFSYLRESHSSLRLFLCLFKWRSLFYLRLFLLCSMLWAASSSSLFILLLLFCVSLWKLFFLVLHLSCTMLLCPFSPAIWWSWFPQPSVSTPPTLRRLASSCTAH